MFAPIFNGWQKRDYELNYVNHNIIDIYGKYMSWQQVHSSAKYLILTLLKKPGFYLIDPNNGIQSFIYLLAVTMLPNCSFLWASPASIPMKINEISKGFYLIDNFFYKSQFKNRPYYGTLTSGTNLTKKIPVGFADNLGIIGMYYEQALFNSSLPYYKGSGVIASCLPLEYTALFMMAILPAWLSARKLIIFNPNDWEAILKIAENEPTVIILTPSLLAAACAYVHTEHKSKNLTFLTTAGYLSQERIKMTKNKFPNAIFQSCYGATETGIISLVTISPEKSCSHVGKPLFSKPIWLKDVNENGIGKIATLGIDCREFYLESGLNIRDSDGYVANNDYGHFDKEGNLYLDGRIDNAIKVNGMLFYPKEIERFILTLNGIEDVKISINQNVLGSDGINILIVGNVLEHEVINHCKKFNRNLKLTTIKIFKNSEDIYTDRGKLKDLINE